MTKEQDELVEENIRLVTYTIEKYHPYAKGDEDMFQIGCIGLIRAAKAFDTSRSVKFSTLAVSSIRGEICKEYRDRYMDKRKANEFSQSLDEIVYENNASEIRKIDLLSDIAQTEEVAINNALIHEVNQKMYKLKENQRIAIRMYYLEGLSQPKIGEITKRGQVNVSKDIKKGCNRLKTMLGVV